MDLQMVYLKERKEFGRAPTHFLMSEPEGLGGFGPKEEDTTPYRDFYVEKTRVQLNLQVR